MSTRRLLSFLFLAATSGCATQHAAVGPATQPLAHHPPLDTKATLSLDQIEPRPTLPAPATAPAGPPPLEALNLYAQARVAEATNQHYVAINLLEKAAKLDPTSFSVQSELAHNYMALSSGAERASDALEKAATIDPNDLETQTNLGRLYLTRNISDKAIERLRLARQSSEYRTDGETAALADYYLAQALTHEGYDRAALESYNSLLQHLGEADHFQRNNPELGYLLARPDMLYSEIGRLQEKQGNDEQALQAFELVADHHPDDMGTRQHIVQLLLNVGRRDEAAKDAADAVVRTHASALSIDILRTVYKGDDNGAVGALRKLVSENPRDTTVLFALADVLVASDKRPEAVNVLNRVASTQHDDKGAGDIRVVRKEFWILSDANKTEQAVRLLLRTSTDRPDTVEELVPLWQELISPVRVNRLHPEQLQAMQVDEDEKGARAYWVSVIAVGRNELERNSLAQATKCEPPFKPAYRAQLIHLLNDSVTDIDKRQSAAKDMASAVEKAGDSALAKELLGTALLARANYASANNDDAAARNFAADSANYFDEAQKLGDNSPELRLAYAQTALIRGDAAAYEKIMWKLLSDRPCYEAAYNQFFVYYEQRGQAERAVSVSQSWLLADPQSIAARLMRIELLNRAGVSEESEQLLTDLYKERPDDPGVLSVMSDLYARSGKPDRFAGILEDRLSTHKDDLAAAEYLVDNYSHKKRTPEAVRVVDNVRKAVGDNADRLYYIAHMYEKAGMSHEDQLAATEATLQMTLKVDPNHAGANNDLGYTWADEGKNLPDAESMIRHAIELEPDNTAFLDSLGWVLYKRGQFAEARTPLEKAIDPEANADPVVLDHLGDVLYRLDARDDASQRWQSSLNHLNDRLKMRGDDSSPNDEMSTLKLHLMQKLEEVKNHKSVDVAPVVGSAEKAIQAHS